ncbi:MAG: NAD-dependent epimerase/dehydratase family protein, partial [Bacteroidales bacterium]|nr:NAD-dependent epimerase/dehydratase family protein [Bacteroidales bacterium]
VTGGSGFLGKAILEELTAPDSPIHIESVINFDRTPPEEIPDTRIKYIQGDIRDEQAVRNACEGLDIVIHSAAIVDWGPKSEKEVYSVNVTGTKNIIRACREAGVSCLVYTSSLDAIFAGKPLVDIDESQPYPEKHPTMYCRSKKLAEEMVLRADKRTSEQREELRTAYCPLHTVILRPADIWGPGDPFHVGSLINMAKGGVYVRLGNGKSKCQHTYVNNVAYAHILAAKALWEEKPGVAGSTYFITDGPATNFFTFFDRIVEGAGYRIRPKNLWLPRRLAFSIGMMNEAIAWLIRPVCSYIPKFSRFAVIYTCCDFTFSSVKASRELGYLPKYNEKEAMEKTIAFFKLNTF